MSHEVIEVFAWHKIMRPLTFRLNVFTLIVKLHLSHDKFLGHGDGLAAETQMCVFFATFL